MRSWHNHYCINVACSCKRFYLSNPTVMFSSVCSRGWHRCVHYIIITSTSKKAKHRGLIGFHIWFKLIMVCLPHAEI